MVPPVRSPLSPTSCDSVYWLRVYWGGLELWVVRFDGEEQGLGHGQDGYYLGETLATHTVPVHVENLVPNLGDEDF